MNIKEEINNLLDFKEIEGSSEKNEALSKIADEYAIGFAEWYKNKDEYYEYEKTIKELLQIFKKEKGL